jgi:hypothetical protein
MSQASSKRWLLYLFFSKKNFVIFSTKKTGIFNFFSSVHYANYAIFLIFLGKK